MGISEPAIPHIRTVVMWYTLCDDPGCGALNDYANSRAEGERNARRHKAWHKANNAQVKDAETVLATGAPSRTPEIPSPA